MSTSGLLFNGKVCEEQLQEQTSGTSRVAAPQLQQGMNWEVPLAQEELMANSSIFLKCYIPNLLPTVT